MLSELLAIQNIINTIQCFVMWHLTNCLLVRCYFLGNYENCKYCYLTSHCIFFKCFLWTVLSLYYVWRYTYCNLMFFFTFYYGYVVNCRKRSYETWNWSESGQAGKGKVKSFANLPNLSLLGKHCNKKRENYV